MRYALYYTPPPDHPLRHQLEKWLGRDPVTNQPVRQPEFPSIPSSFLKELTRTPRRYGPHATLKAPFRLGPGKTERMLKDAIQEFCRHYEPFILPPLIVSGIDNFFCLTMDQYSHTLNSFAAACVRSFDHFRAPATSLEMAKQRAMILSEKEKNYLRQWGYPYVLDTYRFHITLTQRITDPTDREQIKMALDRFFSPALEEPLPVDGVALFVEPGPGENLIQQEYFVFAQECRGHFLQEEKERA